MMCVEAGDQPALEGEDEAEEDDDEHENARNHARQLDRAVHGFFRLHGVGVLRGGACAESTHTHTHTHKVTGGVIKSHNFHKNA